MWLLGGEIRNEGATTTFARANKHLVLLIKSCPLLGRGRGVWTGLRGPLLDSPHCRGGDSLERRWQRVEIGKRRVVEKLQLDCCWARRSSGQVAGGYE